MGSDRQQANNGRKVASKAPGARTTAVTASPVAQPILDLQRMVGNRAVVALLNAAQPKLTVGAADDPYEREADAVANDVMALLRSVTPGVLAEPSDVQPSRTVQSRIHRRPGSTAAGPPEIGMSGGDLDSGAEQQLAALRGGGSPVPSRIRGLMEGAFGADFGRVQLHRGPASEALNRTMGAAAFTVGHDIFLGSDTPSFDQPSGQRLLAHELTHTLQQGGIVASQVSRQPASAIRQTSGIRPEPGQPRKPGPTRQPRRGFEEVVRRAPTPSTAPPTTAPTAPPTTASAPTVGSQVADALSKTTMGVSALSVSGTKVAGPILSDFGSKDLYGEPEKEGRVDSLDIAKIEIRFTPADIKLTQDEVGKLTSEMILSASVNAIKATGKLEVSYATGGSSESKARTVYSTSETEIDAKFAIDHFLGAKAGVEGGYESTSEGQSLKGKAGAFAGLEFTPKTEFVLKANAKELVRFKGGWSVTLGAGGEIEATMQWPGIEGGNLTFTSRGKWALGLGIGWDVDVQIPVRSLMSWLWQNGWEWAKWTASGIGTGLSYGAQGLYNVGWYGAKGLSMAYSGLSTMASMLPVIGG